jgi:hypothetical protein
MFSAFDERIKLLEGEQLSSRVSSLEETVASLRGDKLKLLERLSSLEESLRQERQSSNQTKHNFVLVGFGHQNCSIVPIYLDKDTTRNYHIYSALLYAQIFLVESLKQFTNIKDFDFANSSWSNSFCACPTFRMHDANGDFTAIHKVMQNYLPALERLRQIFAGSDIKLFCRSKQLL